MMRRRMKETHAAMSCVSLHNSKRTYNIPFASFAIAENFCDDAQSREALVCVPSAFIFVWAGLRFNCGQKEKKLVLACDLRRNKNVLQLHAFLLVRSRNLGGRC